MKKEEIVINDLVGYDNLKIYQNNSYFNFSLDSVLLPNFAKITKKTKKIIDLGTGNAPIPLILSTRTKEKIIGIEIQKEIYDLAVKSVKINNLEDQIEIINDDIKNITSIYETDSFDLILSNPPYFKINEKTLKNENTIKSNARHENLINVEDIIKASKKLLKNGASLVMINRTTRMAEITSKLKENNLEPKRIKMIYPKENENSNMFMIEAVKNAKEGLIVEKPLVVHNENGTYTNEVLNMFQRR